MTKIALVTGASSGIGRASAIALSKAGWTLVLSGRREDALRETLSLLNGVGSYVVGDLADPAAVKALFRHVESKHGRLDLLFNNAGVPSPKKPLEEITFDEYRHVLAVNLDAVFHCCQEAILLMKAQKPRGGRIINNGSVSAYAPRPHSAPYTISKHAILGLTRSIALDYREFDIVCSQIDIGNAQSDMSSMKTAGVLQADGSKKAEPVFETDLVGETVAYTAGLPLSVNILTQTLMASHMPFVGRG